MEESKDCYVDIDVIFRRRRKMEKKKRKIIGEGKCLFSGVKGKGGKYLEIGEDLSKICQGY